jgi:nitric oxide synthase oxygenase domain/subunit
VVFGEKGTWLYGTAENIYWESGLWRNGNWYGYELTAPSSIDLTSLTINDNKTLAVLYNVANATNNSKIHLMNVFTGKSQKFY